MRCLHSARLVSTDGSRIDGVHRMDTLDRGSSNTAPGNRGQMLDGEDPCIDLSRRIPSTASVRSQAALTFQQLNRRTESSWRSFIKEAYCLPRFSRWDQRPEAPRFTTIPFGFGQF